MKLTLWGLKNKNTGELVYTCSTRNSARKEKLTSETVVKLQTDDVGNNLSEVGRG